MRTLLAAPVLLAGFALPVVPTYAVAADTCFGLPATIVGTQGEPIEGTAGPDVVITNGATTVDTLAGDDKVCVNRRVGSVDLGGGSDTLTSGNFGVFVDTGDRADARAGLPLGVDSVQTGAGRDFVITGHRSSTTNGDSIQLGAGRDDVEVNGAVPALLDGGDGQDEIGLKSTELGDWVVDGRTGVITIDGVAMPAAASFVSYDLQGLRWDTLVFRGGPGNETVDVVNRNGLIGSDGPFTARMGAGKDRLFVRSQDTGPFKGGPGNDSIDIEARGTVVDDVAFRANLGSDVYGLSGRPEVRAASLENLYVIDADGALVVGDGGANRLAVYGCGVTVRAGAGNDRIRGGAIKGCFEDGATPGLTAYGDTGDDVLRGGLSRDHLYGGPGRDKADGWSGRDQCVAETRVRCER